MCGHNVAIAQLGEGTAFSVTNYHLPTSMVDVVGGGCGLQLMKAHLTV
jgi:hypothetical protein